MAKYELIPEQLLYEGIINESQFFHPDKLEVNDILLTHSEEYWNKLDNQNLSRKEIRNIGFPMTPELIERGRHIAKGTIDCALFALEYGCALNIAGGTHHSFKDRGEGFCVFNDFAIASNYLLDRKIVEKILIIDLDVHQGNGTAKIFENDSRVYTFSVHGEKNYPLRKEKSDLDIELPDNTEDEEYLQTIHNHIPKLINEVNPDIIFYLSGVDVLKTDKLGRLGLTLEGCKLRDEYVFEQCRFNSIPVAVSMGGGYSVKLADVVNAHANTFKSAMSEFS